MEIHMDRYNILTHQVRLQIVFKLKLELLRDVILGKYKASAKDLINLVSDLVEIYQTAKAIEQKERYLK
jgi:hypothetical protein